MSDDWVPSAFKKHQGTTDDTNEALNAMLGETNKVFKDLGVKVFSQAEFSEAGNQKVSCDHCGKLIAGRYLTIDLQSITKHFHPNCFECDRCCRIIYISQGEKFVVRNNKEIWCQKCINWEAIEADPVKSKGAFGEFSNGSITNKVPVNTSSATITDRAIPEYKPTSNIKNVANAVSNIPMKTNTRSANDARDITANIQQGKSICFHCNTAIAGYGVVVGQDKIYHSECFKCNVCSKPITEDTFVTRSNNVYLHTECAKQTGPKCFTCLLPITSKYLTIDNQKYHPNCFVCSICSASISSGFTVREGKNVCMNCAQSKKTTTTTTTTASQYSNGIRVNPVSGKVTAASNATPAVKKPKFCGECGSPLDGGKFCGECGSKAE